MDDCFSKKRKDEPDQLLDRLNNYHPNIKFTVKENPDHFLDTGFSYGNDGFDFEVHKKRGKLPTHWTSDVPIKWKRNCITGALHRAKNISTKLDRDIKEIKITFPKRWLPHEICILHHRLFHIEQFISRWALNSAFSLRRTEKRFLSNSPTARRMKSQAKSLFHNWTLSLISSIYLS